MKAKISKNLILAIVMMVSCLVVAEQAVSAQSPPAAVTGGRPIAEESGGGGGKLRACKEAKGLWIDATNNIGGTSGTIINGGILNGRTESIYSPTFVFTPDPNVVSYVADLTVTTSHGRLKASNVYIYNLVTGVWTAMGRINPETSTGRFAGATGVLYFSGKTTEDGLTYISNVTGETCLVD